MRSDRVGGPRIASESKQISLGLLCSDEGWLQVVLHESREREQWESRSEKG